MWNDPIVDEIHRIREKLAAEHGFDVKAIFADMRRRQTALGTRLVPVKPRTEPMAETDRSRPIVPTPSTPTNTTPAA